MGRSFLLTVMVLLTTAWMVAADVDDADDVDTDDADDIDAEVVVGAVVAAVLFFDTMTSDR